MAQAQDKNKAAKEAAEEAVEAGKGFFAKAGDACKAGFESAGNFFFGTKTRGLVTTVVAAGAATAVYAHKKGDMPYQHDEEVELDLPTIEVH